MTSGIWFSIKTKFVLITVLIVAVFSVTLGSGIIREERQHLATNLERHGRILMTSLKAPIINSMILDEIGIAPGLLDNYVEEIVGSKDLPTAYAFITDQQGKVLAHTRNGEFGKIYRDPLTRGALTGEAYRSALVDSGSEQILDLALPLRVNGKSFGALRVGLSTAPMEAEYGKIKVRVVRYVALIFLVGSVIFYVLGSSMSRPLERLTRSMENVRPGVFEAKPLPLRRDEIGQLQESFNDMLRRLDLSEQERRKALNYLIQNEKMICVGRIVAGVAHEINNPLAAISACVYKLERQAPPSGQNCLDILKAGIQRIETIVRQLSDFSRAGSLELRHVESDLFFGEVQAFAAMALQEYQIRLIAVDGCSPPVPLHIDKGKMHQVVLNLLLNAAAASLFTGLIELRTATTRGWYLLTVKDQGCGVADKDFEKIFDIFYTTKPAGEGSGIGLAVCKSIVDLHGGSIAVACRPGETTFSVRIPLESGVAHA